MPGDLAAIRWRAIPRLAGRLRDSPQRHHAVNVRGLLAACSIACCSSRSGSGTTTLVRQLAMSYARGGRNVICSRCIAERRENQGRRILRPAAGAAPACVSLDSVIQRTAADNIDLLPAGGSDPSSQNPWLDEATIAPILKQLCSKYQIVLIDAPVVTPLGEACVWASACDATVLVLGRASCRSRIGNARDAIPERCRRERDRRGGQRRFALERLSRRGVPAHRQGHPKRRIAPPASAGGRVNRTEQTGAIS